MRQAGRNVCFVLAVGFPSHHDSRLSELARATGPELADVKFSEEAPVATEQNPGRYLLHAYSRGQRYTLSAENLDIYHDLEAVVGLMNQLSRKRGSSYPSRSWPATPVPVSRSGSTGVGQRMGNGDGILPGERA